MGLSCSGILGLKVILSADDIAEHGMDLPRGHQKVWVERGGEVRAMPSTLWERMESQTAAGYSNSPQLHCWLSGILCVKDF